LSLLQGPPPDSFKMLEDLLRQTARASAFLFFLNFSSEALAFKIVDYQKNLSPRFKKQIRQETRFIIIHSTESRLPSALRTLSRGKVWRGRYVTRGGHAHYLIARNGSVYRILDPKYWANHAGVSMWGGQEGLSDYSLGIELEGYHNVPFSEAQYRSLGKLLQILQKRYGIEDRNVLEHYRVAYSAPNHHHQSKLRGRKLDPGAENFDRLKAGLNTDSSEDPDVVAGRISPGLTLARAGGQAVPSDEIEEEDGEAVVEAKTEGDLNRITQTRTAWKIAGAQYNAPTTIYRFPDGRSIPGNKVHDWSDIPPGTQVDVGVAQKVVTPLLAEVVVPEISSTHSAWQIANALYNSSFTFYIFPDGRVQPGSAISQVTAIPDGTKVLVAYRETSRPQTRSAIGEDLEDVYLASRTLYLFPGKTLRSGDQIANFARLPTGVRVFAKVE
jgi:N-acetylmuramoyl-L-alanine amidase